MRKTSVFLMVLMAVLVCGEFNYAMSAIITVTNTNNSGGGSLRQAISTANPGDTIKFSVTGTITLTTGALSIQKNLTITGPGPSALIIDGNANDSVFSIGSFTVNISGLKVQNGKAAFGGGGIYITGGSGVLTLTNVTISGNTGDSGGGIWTNGTSTTLTDVTISGNTATTSSGGGIYNTGGSGVLTLTNVTISGNTGDSGGGIWTNGPSATLTDVTISGNTATTSSGGGINNTGGSSVLTLTNVTISGNTAATGGGGIWTNGPSGTLTNVTINLNSATTGGGIQNSSGAIALRNTIVANSVSGGNCNGTITSLGHNLDSANTCGFGGAGDLINTNPLLGPLQGNGGFTQTHALLAGGPAIDAGDNSGVPPTDQRGFIRIWNGIVDIGAYEYGSRLPSTSVPTITEWGMIIFMILAGIGAVYHIRKRRRADS
jgi:hypothetical protein